VNLPVLSKRNPNPNPNSNPNSARNSNPNKNRYKITAQLGAGQAAFSQALQCVDLSASDSRSGTQRGSNEDASRNVRQEWVCLKVIKNNKDYFDQSLDEIKLLRTINEGADCDAKHILKMYDYFYYKEHLVIVSELLAENLFEFGRQLRESDMEPFFTLSRLRRISHQVLTALEYIHSLNLIHCDIKPENIVMSNYTSCDIKIIDFGSSCYTTDRATSYIQSRSYRAPEVITVFRLSNTHPKPKLDHNSTQPNSTQS